MSEPCGSWLWSGCAEGELVPVFVLLSKSETFPEKCKKKKKEKKSCRHLLAMWSPYPHPQVQLVNIHRTSTHLYKHMYTSCSIKTQVKAEQYTPPLNPTDPHWHSHSEVFHTIKVPHALLLGGNVISVFFWAPWPLTLLLSLFKNLLTVSFYFLCILLLCFILMMDFFMQRWSGWV